MYKKDFKGWGNLKVEIDKFEKLPSVKEREIWWCSVGVNIGTEMDGKNELFHRPVLVLKKLSTDLYLVAPLTSKKKEGTWYIQISFKGDVKTVCLHQIKVVNTKRIGKLVVRLPSQEFDKVRVSLKNLYSF